jgi:hypothetical protein
MLQTALPGCNDDSYIRVFKALLPFEKDMKKKVQVLYDFQFGHAQVNI